MLKYLLIACFVVAIIAMIRGSRRAGKAAPSIHSPQAMEKCSYCGVHFPAPEAVCDADRMYCCIAHRDLEKRA